MDLDSSVWVRLLDIKRRPGGIVFVQIEGRGDFGVIAGVEVDLQARGRGARPRISGLCVWGVRIHGDNEEALVRTRSDVIEEDVQL